MQLASYISHYFEKEAGPFLNICDLPLKQRNAIIEREKDANTGFNRFACGEEFFDFRHLADDLLIECYTAKFGRKPERRPYYGVLGEADVVGGLFRVPHKITIPVSELASHELTFMCPDHFHLVSLMNRGEGKRMFGYQPPENYTETEHPYFGKLMTYDELAENLERFKIDLFVERARQTNNWYRYIEAQIWCDPDWIQTKYQQDTYEVTPESWTYQGVTHRPSRPLSKKYESSE